MPTQEFLRRVADGRKKTVEDVDKIAQGRVWAGVDAQRIGLVDHLGGLKDATDAAAKLAELGSDYDVDYIETGIEPARGVADADSLASPAHGPTWRASSRQRSDIERMLDPVLEQARAIARLNDPRRAVRLLLVPRAAH